MASSPATFAALDENSDPTKFSAATFQASLLQARSPRKASKAPSSPAHEPAASSSLSTRPMRARRTLAAMQHNEGDVSLAIAALPGVGEEDMSRLLDMTLQLGSLSSPVAPPTRKSVIKNSLGTLHERHAAALPLLPKHTAQPAQLTEEELDRLDTSQLERLAWGEAVEAKSDKQTPTQAQLMHQASPQRRARYRRNHLLEQPASAALEPQMEEVPASTAVTKPSLLRKPSRRTALPAQPATSADEAAASVPVSTAPTKSHRGMPSAPAPSPVPIKERVSVQPVALSVAFSAPAADVAPPTSASAAPGTCVRGGGDERTTSSSTKVNESQAKQSPSKLPRKSTFPLASRSASGPKLPVASALFKKKSDIAAFAATPAELIAPVHCAATAPIASTSRLSDLAETSSAALSSSPLSQPAAAKDLLPSTSSPPQADVVPLNKARSGTAKTTALTLPLSPFSRSRRTSAVRQSAVKAAAAVRAESARDRRSVKGPGAVIEASAQTPSIPAGYRLSSTGSLVPLAKTSTFTFVARDARSAAASRARSSAQASRTAAVASGPKANAVPAWLKARKAQLAAEEAARLEADVERVREAELAKGRKPTSSTARRIVSVSASVSAEATTAAPGGFVSSMQTRAHQRAQWEVKRAHNEATLEAVRAAARAEREAREEEAYRADRERTVIRANPVPSAIYGACTTTTTMTKVAGGKEKRTAKK